MRTRGKFKDIVMPQKTTALWLTKNSAKFIGYSVASILNSIDQAIIVDDGSTDRTIDILLALKSPKVQISASNPDKYDMDWNVRFAMHHSSGGAVFFLDDDYVWDRYNASNIQKEIAKAKGRGKWGVDLDGYNIIKPGRYIPPAKGTPDICFHLPDNKVRVGGSFYTDNNTLIHEKEDKGFKSGIHSLGKRYDNYFHCGLSFTHWKFVKDTKEEFIAKYEMFLKMSRADAEVKWNEIHARPTLPYPFAMPQVFFDYRELFVPLGGFDIVKWVEECKNENTN